jgi:hypothetical protein
MRDACQRTLLGKFAILDPTCSLAARLSNSVTPLSLSSQHFATPYFATDYSVSALRLYAQDSRRALCYS